MGRQPWLWAALGLALGCSAGGPGTGVPRQDESNATGDDGTTETMGDDGFSRGDGEGPGDGQDAEVPGSDDEGDDDPGTLAPTFEGDPSEPGAFAVVHDSDGVTIPNPGEADINAGLFVPSTDGTRPATGKFPLVVAHPGFGAQWDMYTELASHLASWGYVVVAINHAGFGQDHMLNAEQTLRTIAWASSDESPIKNVVDTARVATAGHSMGGKIAFLAAYLDGGEHIQAIVGWDPVTAGGPSAPDDPTAILPDKIKQLTQPKLVFGGPAASCSPEGGNADAIYGDAAAEITYFHFPNANHMDWVDVAQTDTIGGVGGAFCGGPDGIPMDVHRITSRTQVAFLKRVLEGYEVDPAYFDPKGPLLAPDVGRGIVQIRAK